MNQIQKYKEEKIKSYWKLIEEIGEIYSIDADKVESFLSQALDEQIELIKKMVPENKHKDVTNTERDVDYSYAFNDCRQQLLDLLK